VSANIANFKIFLNPGLVIVTPALNGMVLNLTFLRLTSALDKGVYYHLVYLLFI